MKKILVYISLFVASVLQVACANPIVIPSSENQRLIAQNLSITTKLFMDAYMSPNIEQRRFAEMYLIGVIDSTEGSVWCGYSIASPGAIQEQAYIGLKGTLERSPDVRASVAIVSKLKELLPCKET